MSNKTYQYVNLRYFNQETTTAHRAILEEQRAGNILDGKMYKLSVDRWNIEQAEFPVFEPIPALTYTVNIRDQDSSTVSSVNVNFGSNKFIYNMADVIASINTAIASACTSHPSPVSSGDIPSLSYDGVLFFIQSTTNFRDLTTGYELGFNEHLFALFHTFPRIPADTVQNPYFLLDGDLVQQPESTLEAIIPVKRIEIQGTLPMLSELLPSSVDSGQGQFSTLTENIITDFNYFPTNGSHIQSITYSAGGNHRWATVTNNQFNNIQLRFYWLDSKGIKYDVLPRAQTSVSTKLAFVEVSELN